MANEEHLAILKKGVKEWNEWRKQNRKTKPDLSKADLRGAEFRGVELGEVNFTEANLSLASASLVDLSGARLIHADLHGADLSGANLQQGTLYMSNLNGINLSGANLFRTTLFRVDLSEANLSEANLGRANLMGANLWRANLSGADLTDTKMGYSEVGNLDLSVAMGIETVRHDAPSTIGIDTIYLSKGEIPEVFLRGAGVPQPFIANMKALVAAMQPIQFYSCFISYSSKDQEFAKRLHADLQQKNVRCWFAPEDMKIGDRIRPRIDEAIRVHDKLLLVLTENSMKSAWVEKEVETAFEKERRQGRTVLFPIRLDDAVMEAEEAWAADIRRTRHIGDFSAWKEHDKYKTAFERLMRDLKAEDKGEKQK